MSQNRPFPGPEVMIGRPRWRGDDDPRALETDENSPCAKAKTRR